MRDRDRRRRGSAAGSSRASGWSGCGPRAGEELRADAVVLATGAWSGRAEWLPEPARPPVRPVKGQILELRSRDGAPPCERIVASERVYLVPRPDGRLIVGATVRGAGLRHRGHRRRRPRAAARGLPPAPRRRRDGAGRARSAGLRPGTPDNLPLIGPGAIEGLVLATGHYRNGILLAPLTADAIADLLAGEPARSVASAHPFRLSLRA